MTQATVPGPQRLSESDYARAFQERILPFWKRMALSITGITMMSGSLAILFGIIGAISVTTDNQITTGAWDIAKIFAGAVVGSAGSTLATQSRGR